MHHKAHVGFVNPHSKRHGSHHDLQIVALELLLHVGTNAVIQPGVIGPGAKATGLQARGGILYLSAAVAVDDAGFASLLLNVAQQLIERLKLFQQRIANVRTVKAADLDQRIAQPEQMHNIAAGGVIRRGGQRHKGDSREAGAQLAERGILGAEIVPPL